MLVQTPTDSTSYHNLINSINNIIHEEDNDIFQIKTFRSNTSNVCIKTKPRWISIYCRSSPTDWHGHVKRALKGRIKRKIERISALEKEIEYHKESLLHLQDHLSKM